MDHYYEILRSFAGATADITNLTDHVEQLAIHQKTPGKERLNEFTSLRRLCVAGATLPLLEQVANLSRLEELAIISPVSDTLPIFWRLHKLRTLLLHGSAKITSIKSLARLRGLETLCIMRAKNVVDYSPIGALKNLTTLEFGGVQYYDRLAIDSLSFLASLRKLQHLSVQFCKVGDGSLRPIGKLPSLRTLEIPDKFPREEFAYLAAKLPNVTCAWFPGYWAVNLDCPKCGKATRVLIAGKGQPLLCKECDRTKFESKLAEFRSLVESCLRSDAH